MAAIHQKLGVVVPLLCAWMWMSRPAAAQIDFSGEWAARLHEDVLQRQDPPGPDIGDYTGLPINDAARLRSQSWDAGILTLREHQTAPFTSIYMVRSPNNMRITKIVDDATQQVIAFKIFRSGFGSSTRMIWMDGRPHPPEYAAHTWQGFSTGKWEGNTLTVETTHVKAGNIQRNGVPHSEHATMIEHYIRHGDYLTVVAIATDPAYLEEPFIRTSNFVMTPEQQLGPVPTEVVDEIAGRPDGYVPHYLPDRNPFIREFAERLNLPFSATQGGKETTYPEYQLKLKKLTSEVPAKSGR